MFAVCPATSSSVIKEHVLILLIPPFRGQGVICFVSSFVCDFTHKPDVNTRLHMFVIIRQY